MANNIYWHFFIGLLMMEHVLDNPAWNALISGNRNLAFGDDEVKFFDKEVSPFVGFKQFGPDSFNHLYSILPHSAPVLYVSTLETTIPEPWKLLRTIPGYQMVYDGEIPASEVKVELKPLTDAHIPQMLELTRLTNPGPFGQRTIDFGHYTGIFDEGKLVAMAGQRMHPIPYAEVSAVCTHPDYLGKGYARQLLIYHINRIRQAGQIPFLHVRNDNDRAIKVYESLGFKTRAEVYFYAIQKA